MLRNSTTILFDRGVVHVYCTFVAVSCRYRVELRIMRYTRKDWEAQRNPDRRVKYIKSYPECFFLDAWCVATWNGLRTFEIHRDPTNIGKRMLINLGACGRSYNSNRTMFFDLPLELPTLLRIVPCPAHLWLVSFSLLYMSSNQLTPYFSFPANTRQMGFCVWSRHLPLLHMYVTVPHYPGDIFKFYTTIKGVLPTESVICCLTMFELIECCYSASRRFECTFPNRFRYQ